ncbi:hypothetical protein [Lysobacter silvisoli]|uniref:DUF2306 domain-containing protein n=1 Tax=Lysobacter silvisoli TaxID=2293254 RepID=A0A371K3V9_9GAMM|nr:hypothetical protein [Lysobacter silvisoli]RDZ28537.1 hypothetical protein DX914_05240 [Lysobacter silvisoli]
MLGITGFGMFHTLLGLVAVAAGFAALIRHGQIALASRSGRAFVWLTLATCITGFFIFRHGGFGKPHVLGIVTLLVLAMAWYAERRRGFGRASAYVAIVGYSLALFFHFIPGYTETLTRVPVAQPWASGPEDPKLLALVGGTFVVYLIGVSWQLLRLRSRLRLAAVSGNPGAA